MTAVLEPAADSAAGDVRAAEPPESDHLASDHPAQLAHAPKWDPRRHRHRRPPRRRLVSLDAVRGLAIVGMLLVNNTGIPGATPTQLKHADWHGLTVADTIFPLFLFAVGVAMPFSGRAERLPLVLRRTALLFIIGSLLVSAKYAHLGPSTGVLQHIAVAYFGCWLLMRLPQRWQIPAVVGLMLAWWAAFAFIPAPGTDPGSYAEGRTLADYVDTIVLGGFSAEGILSSLAGIPSVFGGVVVGRILKQSRGGRRTVLAVLGVAGVALSAGLLWSLVVPINKHLWTPSYTLVTLGISAAVMAICFHLVDRLGQARAAHPLVVLGTNAIAVYVVITLLFAAVLKQWRGQLVAPLVDLGGPTFAAVTYAAVSVALGWAMCALMHRRKIFVKV